MCLQIKCIEGLPETVAPGHAVHPQGHLTWMEGSFQASLRPLKTTISLLRLTENFRFSESLQSFERMNELILV